MTEINLLCPTCGAHATDCDDDGLLCGCGATWPLPEGMRSEELCSVLLPMLAERTRERDEAQAALAHERALVAAMGRV